MSQFLSQIEELGAAVRPDVDWAHIGPVDADLAARDCGWGSVERIFWRAVAARQRLAPPDLGPVWAEERRCLIGEMSAALTALRAQDPTGAAREALRYAAAIRRHYEQCHRCHGGAVVDAGRHRLCRCGYHVMEESSGRRWMPAMGPHGPLWMSEGAFRAFTAPDW